MKTFQVNRNIKIEAEYYKTRYSWGHKAYLYLKNREIEYKKITYYNRTWEAYEFESILESIVGGSKELSKGQKHTCMKFIHNGGRVEDDLKPLKTVAMVSMLGSLLTDNQKDANDWKTRMLKAGLQNKGLIMPDDWETLTEDEKTKRLDGVISILNK